MPGRINETLRIELPLPPKCLHPNASKPMSRGGMIGLNKAKKKARWDGQQAANYALRIASRRFPKWEKATIKPIFRFKRVTGRGHDQDNLIAWLKHYIDGIVDAVVLADDSGVQWLPAEVDARCVRPCVVLEISPLV